MSGSLPGVLFDGIAYGSLLFLISLGLSVTMGLMSFINLAHGAFAMAGGYVCALGMERLGIPFLATLPLAFLAAAAAGALLERTLYRRLYRRSPLEQVLFSLCLTLMAVAATTWVFGPGHQPVRLPGQGRDGGGRGDGAGPGNGSGRGDGAGPGNGTGRGGDPRGEGARGGRG
jgi:branched-chain amino acid transport system permease protein